MLTVEGEASPEKLVKCIGCLTLITYAEWNAGDGACGECCDDMNQIADGTSPRRKD